MLFNALAKSWGISKSSLSEMIVKYENIGLIKNVFVKLIEEVFI